jgi:regulator of sigma E protease
MIDIAGIINTAIPILIFIVILGLVVFVHELGHFLMARRCGIFVEEFAMGMGPKLIAFKGKKKALNPIEGEDDVTLYTLRALPLGGFCKMRGMEENVEGDPESFNNKSVFNRILVIVGGAAMNFLLAVILFFVLAFLVGYNTPTVAGLQAGRPAQAAGMQVGDRITHINGSRVSLWENLTFAIEMSGGEPMDVRVNRDGQRLTLTMAAVQDPDGVFRIGMNPTPVFGRLDTIPEGWGDYYRTNIIGSLGTAVEMIGFHISTPFRMLARFVTRQSLPEGVEVVSIVGIGAQVTEVYQVVVQHGILPTVLTMISIAGAISAAIGIMNLLPIPALDGARLLFLIVEAIRRKPIPQEKEGMVHTIGFVVLIVLILALIARDIVRLI